MAPFFEISPQSALIDEHLAINLFDLAREQPAMIHAQVVDGAWTIWEAQAAYQPGSNGRVSLNSDAPLSGTYQGIDATGLFWSMKSEDRSTRFTIPNQAPLTYTLQAQVRGENVARVQVQRQVLSKDVMRLDVRERGLVGTFFIPTSTAPHPAVIVLGGSENGARENDRFAGLSRVCDLGAGLLRSRWIAG